MKGKITISRVQCSHEDDYICIQIVDESSGTRFVEVKIAPETLTNVLTGLASQECEFKTRDLSRIGLKRETKTESVQRPKMCRDSESAKTEIANLLLSFEVDGWIANQDDAYNNHRWSDDNKVRVGFTRYVDT